MLASARYVYGDEFGTDEYRNIRTWNVNERGREFSKQVMEEDPMVCCIPAGIWSLQKGPPRLAWVDFCRGLLPRWPTGNKIGPTGNKIWSAANKVKKGSRDV